MLLGNVLSYLAVDIDGSVPLILVKVFHQSDVQDTCAVHQNVHRAQLRLCLLHHLSHLQQWTHHWSTPSTAWPGHMTPCTPPSPSLPPLPFPLPVSATPFQSPSTVDTSLANTQHSLVRSHNSMHSPSPSPPPPLLPSFGNHSTHSPSSLLFLIVDRLGNPSNRYFSPLHTLWTYENEDQANNVNCKNERVRRRRTQTWHQADLFSYDLLPRFH